MASQSLLEGVLDIKVPRGSEDRKLWKAWRRQWINFSVIYPSGRREPFLLLQLAHRASETIRNQIRISRDGLRLFRCRSRSRPYRTWALLSGEKPLLFFAAESEVRAQEWMQSVRDGLWPPCFSFQMLTACTHEVSLIDDDNTFLSGLLGVYGRLVLTSKDVISLMHPHWGAALLQITLTNIQDIYLVREAEVAPAGVFRITLKGDEDTSQRTLQFYCSTAKDAIQWILSKVFIKDVQSMDSSTIKCRNSASVTSNKIDNSQLINPFIVIGRNNTSDTRSKHEKHKIQDMKNNFLLSKDFTGCSNSLNDKDLLKETCKQKQSTNHLLNDFGTYANMTKEKQLPQNVEPHSNPTEDILYENLKQENTISDLKKDTSTDNGSITNSHTKIKMLEKTQFSDEKLIEIKLKFSNFQSNTMPGCPEYAAINKRPDTYNVHKQVVQLSTANILCNKNVSPKHLASKQNVSDVDDSFTNVPEISDHSDTDTVCANANKSYAHNANIVKENVLEYATANKTNPSKHKNHPFSSYGYLNTDMKNDMTVLHNNASHQPELNVSLLTSKQEIEQKVNSFHTLNQKADCTHPSPKDTIKLCSTSSSETGSSCSIPCKNHEYTRRETATLKSNLLNQRDNSHSQINASFADATCNNDDLKHLPNIERESSNTAINSEKLTDLQHRNDKVKLLSRFPNYCLDTSILSSGSEKMIELQYRNDIGRHLPNIPNYCLDTSIASLRSNKEKSDSISSEEDAGTAKQLWIEEDCDNDQEFTNHIYEHLTDRRGTIYEEIDDLDDDCRKDLELPPLLPERPPKLEIPSSFRLQKLSQSISEVLQEIKTPSSSTKGLYIRPKLVKKIKENGRIMHV